MSYPVLLNIDNQVGTNQFRYRFSQPIDFGKYEVALGSINIFYSWRAITAARGNNRFQIIWPTASTTTTYTITLPDGTYSASDINNYIQYWSILNNLYLINDTTGQHHYFISCAENPSSYAIQFNMTPVQNLTGYTAAGSFPTMPVSAYTPQLSIIDSGSESFGSIVGFSQATYPATQQTTAYSVYSDITPQIDPVSSVIVGLSCLYNPIANNTQALYTFSSAGVSYGGLITTSQDSGIAYCPCQGQNTEILLSFYDQSMRPLQIIDPNVCIRLLFRPAKLTALQ